MDEWKLEGDVEEKILASVLHVFQLVKQEEKNVGLFYL